MQTGAKIETILEDLPTGIDPSTIGSLLRIAQKISTVSNPPFDPTAKEYGRKELLDAVSQRTTD